MQIKAHTVLFILSTVMGREISNSTVYTCGQQWMPSLISESTENEYVKVVLSHYALPVPTDLVEGLTYNVTLSSEQYRTVLGIFLLVYADNGQMNDTNNRMDIEANTNEVAEVVIVSCPETEGYLALPLRLFWKAPENTASPCFSFVSVILVPGRKLRTRPQSLCKPEVCPKYYTALSNTISYTSDSHSPERCSFIIISLLLGQLMKLQLVRVQSESSSRPCEDYLLVSVGNSTGERICGQLTLKELPKYTYITDTGIARIELVRNTSQGNIIFSATYRIYHNAWSSAYSHVSGMIYCPHFSQTYHPNSYNVTRIKLPSRFRIIIYSIFVDLGSSSNQFCAKDALIIRDTASRKKMSITCGQGSSYQRNQIIFESDSSEIEMVFLLENATRRGRFQFYYEGVEPCMNETHVDTSGHFSSPNFPYSYLSHQQCFHVIQGMDNIEHVVFDLSFVYFHTRSDMSDSRLRDEFCTVDFVEIFSGGTQRRVCGDWTGQEHLLTFKSLPSPVILRFVSDSNISRPGFLATWTKMANYVKICPAVHLEFSSSHFEVISAPQTWQDSEIDCRSKGGHLAKIDDDITHDFIVSRLLASQCQSADSYWIGANDIHWESDFYWTTGEKVTYSPWFPGWHDHSNYSRQPSDDGISDEDCVEVRRRFHLPWKGTREAHGYFWNDRGCNVQNPYICRMDHLNMPILTPRETLIGAPTTTITPAPNLSCDTNITLTFPNNSSPITSIGHPGDYKNFLNCSIFLRSPLGTGLGIDVHEFTLEQGSLSHKCDYDFLEMTSLPSGESTEKSKWRFCGDWTNRTKLLHRRVASNTVWMTFSSDHSRTFSGFSLTAFIVNGSEFCGTDDWILFDHKCVLLSRVAVGHTEARQSCDTWNSTLLNTALVHDLQGLVNTVWKFYDADLNSISIQLWLSTEPNNQDNYECEMTSSPALCPALDVDLTDKSSQGASFVQETVSLACDSKKQFVCIKPVKDFGSKKALSKPDVYKPGNVTLSDILERATYPNNINLTWSIKAPPDHRILTTVTDLQLEFQPECLYDLLSISNLSSPAKRFCGNITGNSSLFLLSDSNIVLVNFISDFSITGTGFTLAWEWLDMGTCHRSLIINASHIAFSSINYPNPFPSPVQCSLTLQTGNDSDLIVLDFTRIQPLTLVDCMSVSFSEEGGKDDAMIVNLTSTFYRSNGAPVFLSDTGYLKLTYTWPGGVQEGEGFEGSFYSEPRPLSVPERVIRLQESSYTDIYSINFPGTLPHGVIQRVTVRVPIGHNVQVDLVNVTLSSSGNCTAFILFEDTSLGFENVKFLEKFCLGEDGYLNETATNVNILDSEDQEDLVSKENLSVLKNQKKNDISNQRRRKLNADRIKEYLDKKNVNDSIYSSETMSTTATSFLNRLRITISSGTEPVARVKLHFTARSIEDPGYIDKTSDWHDVGFDSCQSDSCLNEGVCHQIDDVKARCDCAPQYTGLFCQSLWCDTQPCLHGWCNMTSSGFVCQCQEGHWGLTCDLDVVACERIICNGHGQCVHGNSTNPECHCNVEWSGPMCAEKLDEENQDTTVGERLLKEPILIGLIVILSVILLFTILYIIRRKCGRHFHCCDIKTPKSPDSNILNADGTITLNSFPLRKMSRAQILIPTSPSLASANTSQSEASTKTAGAKCGLVAARFFASYKDAERSPIGTHLTTDFSRTTDISIAQDSGDASVGPMLAGRLQLDLHSRENKEQQESMTRAHSLLDTNHKARDKIRRSHSTGPFLTRQEAKCEESAVTEQGGKATINELEHIYPTVIVQPPDDKSQHSDDEYNTRQKLSTQSSQACYADASGAHVIEVNIEGNRKSVEGVALMKEPTCAMKSCKHNWHSADSIYRLESVNPTEQEKLDTYADVLREWKNRVRQRYRIAKLAAQREKDELYSLYALRNRKSKSKSTPCIHDQNLCPNPIRRTVTVEEDIFYLSDVARRREHFSSKPKRLYASLEELENYERNHRRHHPSVNRKWESSFSSCECSACIFNRSESLTSEVSSRSTHGSRERPDRRPSYRDRRRTEKVRLISSPNTSEQSKHSRRQRNDSTDSHRHKQYKIRQSSSARSLLTHRLNPGSSTDSDYIKSNSRSPRTKHKLGLPSPGSKAPKLVATNALPPTIEITRIPSSGEAEKDLFRKVFSEEIELDDFSPMEEDDDVLQPKCNSKENFLTSDPSFDFACVQDDNSGSTNDLCSLAKSNKNVQDKKTSIPLETRRRNSVVTVKTGSFEGVPMAGKTRRCDNNCSGSSGTPSTCTVILYDSNKSLDNQDTPTIKSRILLTRKHSSLDLTEPLRFLYPGHQFLRNAASMHELSNAPIQDMAATEDNGCSQIVNEKQGSVSYTTHYSNVQNVTHTSSEKNYCGVQSTSNLGPNALIINVDESNDCVTLEAGDLHAQSASASSMSSSSLNISPQQRRNTRASNTNQSDAMCTGKYLSVTDTDSAMSSTSSPQATPNAKTVLKFDRMSAEAKVKDSAYQTKQSSMEVESSLDLRLRRPVGPIREEERRVTQRLHQAAVKLLVMQQRLRRARQNMSKDSAVHTISEDDPTLDDIIVTSPKTRTFKPGVLYPATHEEETMLQYPHLQYAKIVEEQDATIEYKV